MLRANLRYLNPEAPASSVLITSASPGDGKSTVAWNLAAAGANAGSKSVLIEAELRRPVLVREFNLPPSKGLTEILTEGVAVEHVAHRFRVGASGNGTADHATMDVVVAGRRPPNPVDLLQSERMQELIAELEQDYDLVVIDTSPMGRVADAIPLISHADGVLLCMRIGRSNRDETLRVAAELVDMGATVLGLVVNGGDRVGGAPYVPVVAAGTSRRR
jgi:receptor protein-tyrosine kinase